MNETASEQAAAMLAQRHDRDDILAGVDLAAQDEQVTKALMAMARLETMPRTNRLAQEIKKGILAKGLEMYSRPVQSAAFSVLKSPDIPSVLIELGFLTSTTDFSRLNDVVWRSAMQNALVDAVVSWAKDDPNVQQYFSR
jgi:N-acetylmuramoyl-L-alanine amidase